jgi:hypothetical protein
MPPGEEMFNFHGYSGDCPKPPLPKPPSEVELLRAALTAAEARADTLMHLIQREQPAGSPPPGDWRTTAEWVLLELRDRAERGAQIRQLMLRAALDGCNAIGYGSDEANMDVATDIVDRILAGDSQETPK